MRQTSTGNFSMCPRGRVLAYAYHSMISIDKRMSSREARHPIRTRRCDCFGSARASLVTLTGARLLHARGTAFVHCSSSRAEPSIPSATRPESIL
ncbi:hypothetical protein PQR51_06950 [Caballeronia grimmiae]